MQYLEYNRLRYLTAVLGVSPGVGGGGAYRYVPPKGQGSRFGDR